MNPLFRFRLFLWFFGHVKVRLIGHLKPRLLVLNDHTVVVKLALNRRSRNHLGSMYFGALAVGADLAGGLHAFYYTKLAGHKKTSIAFKSFEAQFVKRPEANVFFVCTMGESVKSMITDAVQNHTRVNRMIKITAYTGYPAVPEEVATFNLELSVKVL